MLLVQGAQTHEFIERRRGALISSEGLREVSPPERQVDSALRQEQRPRTTGQCSPALLLYQSFVLLILVVRGGELVD